MTDDRYPLPTGGLGRRIHGARRALLERSKSARYAAQAADANGQVEFAAALRGKAVAYHEAADLFAAIEHGHRLPRRLLLRRRRRAELP